MQTNKEKNFISCVIYMHNNEADICSFLENVTPIFNDNFSKYEIICVDDSSSDNTVHNLKNYAKNQKNAVISILNMSHYQGLEASMCAGVDLSIGDFVFEFDTCTVDYDINTIMKIYQKALEGYDIVNAVPDKKSHTSSLFYNLFNNQSKMPYKLQRETFRILSRRVINRIGSISDRIFYRKAFYASCGLPVTNLIYETKNNLVTKPKNSEEKANRNELAINSLILFTSVGYNFALFMSLLMMFAAAFSGIYTIYIFLNNNPVAGWTTTMFLISFGLFGLFAILTIVIKYLSILIELTFKKQQYVVKSIEKIAD